MKISDLLSKEDFKKIFLQYNFSTIYLDSLYCKHINEFYTIFSSHTYNSEFIFIPNNSYKLMLANLCNATDIYCTYIHENSLSNLFKDEEFIEIFRWFFNDTIVDYIGNFCFICKQLKINKNHILQFLIYITKLKLNRK